MIKTSKQLKDLIRNFSKKNAADAQILMRNYMMERFLERVSLSEYKDHFVLKGGMLIAAMMGLDTRSTMDMDATIKGVPVNEMSVKEMVKAILAAAVDDGVKFRVKRIQAIMEEAEYPGVRVSMETEFDGVITPLKVDFSTGDVITPKEVRYRFKLMLEPRFIKDAPSIFDEVEQDSVMEKLWHSYQEHFPYAADLSWHTVMEPTRKLYAIASVI